jgi:hypothetical protein
LPSEEARSNRLKEGDQAARERAIKPLGPASGCRQHALARTPVRGNGAALPRLHLIESGNVLVISPQAFEAS